MTPFRVVVADPPWSFRDQLPGRRRGAVKHYRCMPIADIVRFGLPIGMPPLAADCFLFLWRVSAMQAEALRVVAAWGFEQKTEIVWYKKTAKGKTHFGMGRITRGAHETCLVCTRGEPEVKSHSVRDVFSARVRRHSEKPEEFYRIVEHLTDGPYLELFSRRERPGWTCVGDQVGL